MPPKRTPDLYLPALARAKRDNVKYCYSLPITERPHDAILPRGKSLWYLISRTDHHAAKARDMVLPVRTISTKPTKITIT